MSSPIWRCRLLTRPPQSDCLIREPEWVAPILWRSEFRNVLAPYLRKGMLRLEQALAIQDEMEALFQGREYRSHPWTSFRWSTKASARPTIANSWRSPKGWTYGL